MRRLFTISLLVFAVSFVFAQSYPGANDAQPVGLPDPPNDPPVWTSTPDPTFAEGVASSYDVSADYSDPDGDTITLVEEAGCTYPTGVTLDNPNKEIDASTGTTEATTPDCVLSADDGTNAPVDSSAFSVIVTGAPSANIIKSYEYENSTYQYLDWHALGDQNFPYFWGTPNYGRPTVPVPNVTTALASFFGDGSLMGFVTSPVRCGTYANKITVKNSVNGSEPADCDGSVCTRRRTELNNHTILWPTQGDMARRTEYWIAISFFIPADWDDSGSGWGPIVFQIKSDATDNISPTFHINLTDEAWLITHRWSDTEDCNNFGCIPWWYGMTYTGNGVDIGAPGVYPNADNWPDGLAHFPNTATSHAALQSVNKGGWTDFVINIKWDGRGAAAGGVGFLDLWKRENVGSWIKILHITPGETTRGGQTFDHGIGYPISSVGFGVLTGMYMEKGEVWGLAANRVIYNDCLKIGNSSATFSQMSPDGSSP